MKLKVTVQITAFNLVLMFTNVYANPVDTEPGIKNTQLLGPKNCQFLPIAEWQDKSVSWNGGCESGKAHGLGVLRAYRKGEKTLIFFGKLENGELCLGVMDTGEGYRAGQFSEGNLVPNQERNAIINAFRTATEAAKAYSQRLLKEGNKQSAEFYLNKAKELEQQMD